MPEEIKLDLHRLEAVATTAKQATPGNSWFYQENSDAYTHIVRVENPAFNNSLIVVQAGQRHDGHSEAVARHIAATNPDVVLELIRELNALRQFGPAEVARDASGWWWHPKVPDFGGGEDPAPYIAWIKDQGLELKGWNLGDEIDHHPYEEGECHCNGWNPQSPGPEWFLMGIYDTEDGPYVSWARREVTP